MHVLILGGGSCNFQPCFRGGSVIFVPKGGGGPCVFYQPHFQMLRPTPPPPPPPILFDQSLEQSTLKGGEGRGSWKGLNSSYRGHWKLEKVFF